MERLTQSAGRAAYLSELSKLKLPEKSGNITVLDLFAGCGGLSLGFEAAGFQTIGFEKSTLYSETYNRNLVGNCQQVVLDESTEYPPADVVIGGPPCQPWSEAGKNLGSTDERDGFPAFIHCIKKVQPKLFIVENVKGLTFEKNRPYLTHIIHQFEELGYTTECHIVRMSDYGVPQNRERLFIVGHHGHFSLPPKCQQKFTVHHALGSMAKYPAINGKYLTPSEDEYIANYEEKCQLKTPRDLHLDRPARTLTCRNLSGSTSDMLRLVMPDGRRRKLRVKEAARLQAFPDWFTFTGSDAKAFEQIGQSVPPLFSFQLAKSVTDYLNYITKDKVIVA
uniref:DNA (cytosine-5-)-methyltransferase n=1 Tax=uncultured marine group II/III euryarchaeote KM3_87_B04 TaxID=1456530 RepID=A0A075HY86_9EURY|nr:C-5 cytosine-specific DNA methylase (DNMT, dcm) [uncultured marine group II/III euryarchaeote KM3_87_B04]